MPMECLVYQTCPHTNGECFFECADAVKQAQDPSRRTIGKSPLLAAPYDPVHPSPIDMILFCPQCGLQHVDQATAEWSNPPHRSHLCHQCNYVWRPADVPTNGVAEISTTGKSDSPRSRGRAPAVLVEQRRIERLIEDMLQFEGLNRAIEMRRNLLAAIKQR